jgi:3'-phosphoadenosine 5'-phosphosulfate sulfotransferase (PAPS reductase)/FAD synthetase
MKGPQAMPYTIADLIQKQSLDLDSKIRMTINRIKQWYERWDGDVYVAFSGGKDSTVLLDLVRSVYPDVPAVFADTGLEYPEIKEFVAGFDNVVTVRPAMPFHKVIKEHGYPVLSKKTSMGLDRYRNTNSDVQRKLRLWGGVNPTSGKKQEPSIPQKWHHLTEAPFKCSDRCCDIMKKRPMAKYGKETGRKPFIGTMADEGEIRRQQYLKHGCNMISKTKARSCPLSFWTEADIWAYIESKSLPYAKIYDMGEERTGCMYCLFGIEQESAKGENRFQRMARSHPKQWSFCMDKLGIRAVMDFLWLPVDPDPSIGCDHPDNNDWITRDQELFNTEFTNTPIVN